MDFSAKGNDLGELDGFLEDFEIYYAFLQGNLRDAGECNITVTLDLEGKMMISDVS